MSGTESPNAAVAARLLSNATGAPYRFVGQLAGGETGAHEFAAPDGRRVVVKWDAEPSSQAQRSVAVGLSDRLRTQAGWPVPKQETVAAEGLFFVIQDLVPGAPIGRLTHSLVDELLELHAARIGLARPEDASRWPERLIATLTVGGHGYCIHESLRNYDARTVRLIERVEAIGRDVASSALGSGDIIHWDFHPGNVLERDGRVSAVIDTDFVTTGDAAFDLARGELARDRLRAGRAAPPARHRRARSRGTEAVSLRRPPLGSERRLVDPQRSRGSGRVLARRRGPVVRRLSGQLARRRSWRTSRRRSRAVYPPHTPIFSRLAIACSRHVSRTMHMEQISLASWAGSSSSSG